ncbi:hypothetical protein C8J57DRAFT_1233798 [Mycena rebaudengoi]|nr:hypothetical protein C8J57DRAFT_1233798 [Mycena rebaudengoi]
MHPSKLFEREAAGTTFPTDMRHHRCGGYPALNYGVSYGKGQTAPSMLNNGVFADMLHCLVGDNTIWCMATFSSNTFVLWAPQLYSYYHNHWDALHHHLPHLSHVFPKSCSILALSPFNPTQGRHLILWDLKMLVEFPAGTTILVPQHRDKHVSFMQFTASGLMHFVNNGFRTEKQLAEEDPMEYECMWEPKKMRWEMGLRLLNTIDKLLLAPLDSVAT